MKTVKVEKGGGFINKILLAKLIKNLSRINKKLGPILDKLNLQTRTLRVKVAEKH